MFEDDSDNEKIVETENNFDDDNDSVTDEALDGQIQFSVVNDQDKQSKNTISADLIRGHINTIILRTLDERDKYGYEIMDEIQSKSLGQYELKQPTLYSALKRLEKQGYVTAYWKTDEVSLGGRRKYFTLTELGKEITEQNRKEWEYTRSVIDTLISDKPYDFTQPAPGKVDFSILKKATSRVPNIKNEYDDEDNVDVQPEIESEFSELSSSNDVIYENDVNGNVTRNENDFARDDSDIHNPNPDNQITDFESTISENAGHEEYESIMVEEAPTSDTSTFIDDPDNNVKDTNLDKINTDSLMEMIRVAVANAFGDMVKDASDTPSDIVDGAIFDGEITDISAGINKSEDNPELNMSLFEDTTAPTPTASINDDGPNAYYESEQLDISDIIKSVVHEVLNQEGILNQEQKNQYIQSDQQTYSENFGNDNLIVNEFQSDTQFTDVTDNRSRLFENDDGQQNQLFDKSQSTSNPSDDLNEQNLEQSILQKEQVHEKFITLVNETSENQTSDTNVNDPSNIDTDSMIYNNHTEAERNYTDIIYGIYDQSIKYPQKQQVQQQQNNVQTPQPTPVQHQRTTSYVEKKAMDDGLHIYTADNQASSNIKHSGPYNVGMTVFKASIIPGIYVIILSIFGFIFENQLGVNNVYPSVFLIIGALLIITCAIFPLIGYKKNAVRPITHGYISVTIVLCVIAILFICILSLALDTDYHAAGDIMAKMVLPSFATLAAPFYAIGYYLMSQNKKVSN